MSKMYYFSNFQKSPSAGAHRPQLP